jgi:hypothetical protein
MQTLLDRVPTGLATLSWPVELTAVTQYLYWVLPAALEVTVQLVGAVIVAPKVMAVSVQLVSATRTRSYGV